MCGQKLKNEATLNFEATIQGLKMNMKVCVVGLGQIGFPVAQYIHAKGLQVWGYDISEATVERAGKMGQFKTTNKWADVPPADVYIICVTTGQVDGCPDLKAVFDVCQKISQRASSSTLVTIESTIVPGASRKIFTDVFGCKIKLVHAPHRYWADEPVKHGVNQIRVIGGVDAESLKAALEFYQNGLGIPIHVCSSVEVAEMCKITENSHRYLQIAFAEDLKMLCAKIGMSFEDLRAAMNTKWNVDLPEARDGIGRHCLPKDIRYVTSLAPSTLLDSAMRVDKEYREWLAKQKKQ
jgi:nucleotide sugar dehydrogenase